MEQMYLSRFQPLKNVLIHDVFTQDITVGWKGWDLQEQGNRYHVGVRYLNSVDGQLQKKWQITYPSAKDDKNWAYCTERDWCTKGIDPFWFGRRYPDGRHDGFKDIRNGLQSLCYNETDCKINWQYLRLLIDREAFII